MKRILFKRIMVQVFYLKNTNLENSNVKQFKKGGYDK